MEGSGRGRYKIFLGMAAGVGKTFRMLQEGQAARADGRDVVIGYLEPHDRPETEAQAEGLERLPRRRVEYRGREMEEMDLPAIFRRAPELCLIDELAHTNAPGLEHAKRYDDIDDVLDAGIDVFSTVNVQHLESLNDQVLELTGVRVRETFPDRVLASADEVVLVDLTPEALVQRLREGRVYPAERVPTALNSFFRVENLAALREVALRQVAEEVEAKRLISPAEILGTREEALFGEAPQPVAERVLVLVRPGRDRAAGGAPCVALGPAAVGGARPALRGPAGPPPARHRARAARGAAPPGLDPRIAADRRGGRGRRRDRGAGGRRARHHLPADGTPARAPRRAPGRGIAARAADAPAARRGPADRGGRAWPRSTHRGSSSSFPLVRRPCRSSWARRTSESG